MDTEIATLASGCFWCGQAIYKELKGVEKAVSGYSGGRIEHPSYELVCAGRTGHAEAVQITFRPEEIAFADLLVVFWEIHDPTTLNRQGNDVGEQYRSAIFFHSEAQHRTAEQSLRELDASRKWPSPIVTALEPFRNFFPAEEYHQDFFLKNPDHGYCRLIISPKVAKFRNHFEDKLKMT
jgi:peptide-methionine (S)-S-oxide reductase